MRLLVTLAMLMTISNVHATDEPSVPLFPRISVETTQGTFVLELDGSRSPITVMNFVRYVNDGQYNGTIFHRVIPGFMAQAGGYVADYGEKEVRPPIPNESGNGLRNERGTIAMARMGKPHTATSQFFINLSDNAALHPRPRRWGYTVFGLVVEGMDVVDLIAKIPTASGGPFPTDVPQSTVLIKSMKLIDEP
jgi:cyclophilin family peptidyl-prolyl cis-trans isomerase